MGSSGSPPGLTRRTALAAAGLMPLLPGLARAAGQPERPGNQRLWYRQPASRWEEALPLGNGRLGAMVFGRVAQERLQLNEDTLWAGAPYTPDNPEANAALPEVRRLIAAGRYKEATELASAKMMAKPLWQMAYGTLGDLLFDFVGAERPSSYERSLDLGSAIATTRFAGRRGRVCREAFVSAPDHLIVLRMDGPRGGLDFDLSTVHMVGLYPDYASAYDAWRGHAQRTVDDAEMKYVLVHLHRLLEPDLHEA